MLTPGLVVQLQCTTWVVWGGLAAGAVRVLLCSAFLYAGFCLNPSIMRALIQSARHQLVAWSSLLVLYLFLY